MGDRLYRREYGCEFEDVEDGVFDRDLVERAISHDFAPLAIESAFISVHQRLIFFRCFIAEFACYEWIRRFNLSSNDVMLLTQQPLNLRCLALTGTFETSVSPPGCFGCVTGDFDGQGISYSALQWNLGESTLQPLLSEMNTSHPDIMGRIFGVLYAPLCNVLTLPRSRQMEWARSIQSVQHQLDERWQSGFRALGESAEFQAIVTRHAASLFDGALALCRTYALESQRAVALMFDIKVQNGTISPPAHARIEQDFSALSPGEPDAVETAKMRSVANCVADSANVLWREDVRTRKLAVANGTGVVHGIHYDLAAQYGLTLEPSGHSR